jgi:hypothetical protein
MARKQVVEVACSRCQRVETVHPAHPDKMVPTEKPEPTFRAILQGSEPLVVSFEDLCTPCMRTVRALLEQVGKRIEGMSPDRKAAPKKPEAKEKGAANGSTPHPAHSAAAGTAASTKGAADRR